MNMIISAINLVLVYLQPYQPIITEHAERYLTVERVMLGIVIPLLLWIIFILKRASVRLQQPNTSRYHDVHGGKPMNPKVNHQPKRKRRGKWLGMFPWQTATDSESLSSNDKSKLVTRYDDDE